MRETYVEKKMMTVHPNLLDPYAQQTVIMNGLKKFTEYNITVLCFTDPGDGEISQYVYVKTKEDGKERKWNSNLEKLQYYEIILF